MPCYIIMKCEFCSWSIRWEFFQILQVNIGKSSTIRIIQEFFNH